MSEEHSTNYKILMTLRRIASKLDEINDILKKMKNTDDEDDEDDEDEEYESPALRIKYRVRKYSWDIRGQVAATYTLDDAIALCPVGYCVFNEENEVMYRNLGCD